MPSLKRLWENISLIYLISDDCHTKAEQWSRGKGLSSHLLQGLEFPILSNSWDNCKKETILSWSKGEAIVIEGDVNAENKAAGALTICYSAKQGSTVTKLQCYVTLYCKPLWGILVLYQISVHGLGPILIPLWGVNCLHCICFLCISVHGLDRRPLSQF